MGIEADLKGGSDAVRKHWIAVLLVGAVLVVVALWYDHKNSGKLTVKLAGLPGIGKLFS